MKVLKPVKRLVDDKVRRRVKCDGTAADIAKAKMSRAPYSAIAVEGAVRLTEAGVVSEFVAMNKGAESPSFSRADVGREADLSTAVPEPVHSL